MSTNAAHDLRNTIIPKSDQLNAEQLLGGPRTITVTEVTANGGAEQPVVVHYEDEDGRPYKPCKTMRKVLIFAWGSDGRQWVGKALTLYNDETVRFGNMAVGGIRISHMSDIDKDMSVALTKTKGQKALYVIKKMAPVSPVKTRSKFNVQTTLDAFAALDVSAEQVTQHLGHAPTESDRAELGRWYKELVDRPVPEDAQRTAVPGGTSGEGDQAGAGGFA
jgi:hypothetical protein